ncbi:MAG TPA: hypothetical protein VMA35_03650 [Candidatus Sulfopaludibacter sp.]|nr:hypothetical protein [Candidatus Sulfopaludibacter sp.]
MVTTTKATAILNAESPLGVFTNTTSRLLMAQFNLDASWIQIYPTNQYTPAVHRLLQLAANVYEATSTNSYPSVFRPLFSRDTDGFGTNLFISGFTNVEPGSGPNDGQLSAPMEIAALAQTDIPVINLPVNVYGIPWIIGARKGFPNFNKFDMESAFQLIRKLQVTRDSTNETFAGNPGDYHFNQMFNLSLSNQFGVECWNSYTNSFNDSVAIYVRDDLTHAILTNDEGFSADFPVFPIAGCIQITNGNVWPGYNPLTDPFGSLQSFQIPLYTNVIVIPNSLYRFNNGAPGAPFLTTNLVLPYEQNVTVNGQLDPQPHWWLIISNEIQVFMLDTTVVPNRVIDYVQLSGPNSVRDLTSEIISNYDVPISSGQPGGSQLWNTNSQNGWSIGLLSQVGISMGNYTASTGSGTWDQSDPALLANEIAGFEVFMGYTPNPPLTPGEAQAMAAAQMSNAIQAPYTPTATVVQHVSWQANDPLVHHLASDLNWGLNGESAIVYDRNVDNVTNNSPNGNLGIINQSYRPWGGNPVFRGADQNSNNIALKDPLVQRSDDWDFPTNESLSGVWLGRVHRGTPWQTVYLKASDILQQIQVFGGVTNYIGTNTWMAWTGDANTSDAVSMAPVQDRHLASLLAYLMNTNDLPSLFPVNATTPNAWPGLLNGLMALTNTASDSQIAAGGAPQFVPVAISSNSPQLSFIVNAIQSAQSSQPGHFFSDVGDILSIPQLTEQSPFLNWNDAVQQQQGIGDEAYEILPSQLLPLLRADSIGSVSSANGQHIVRFTGYDNHLYALQVSTNLSNWVIISSNFSAGGGFGFTNAAPFSASPQFFRSLLVQ